MAIFINTNLSALKAQNNLNTNQARLSKAMQRLASGLRINNASDDPAGLAVALSMTQTIDSLKQGAQNGYNGLSLVETAQSAMMNIANLVTSMSTLASQAASGVYSSSQLNNINTTFEGLKSEVLRIAGNTQFNGINLLDGSRGSLSIQLGANNSTNDRLSIQLSNLSGGASGLSINNLSLSSAPNAQSAMTSLQSAVSRVNSSLANACANTANLSAAVQNNLQQATNLTAARSRIQDADFAEESSMLAKYSILTSSNIAMLTQANSIPKMALTLLQNKD